MSSPSSPEPCTTTDEHPIARFIDDIAGAIKSDQPLRPDPDAQALLDTSIHNAATERPSPIGETPSMAATVSGKPYRFDGNALNIRTVSLTFTGTDPSWQMTMGKPDQPARHFTGLIGLDGLYRINPPAGYGIDAIKGRWLNQHTFAIDHRVWGARRLKAWTFAFDGNAVDIRFETTDGPGARMHGQQDNPSDTK